MEEAQAERSNYSSCLWDYFCEKVLGESKTQTQLCKWAVCVVVGRQKEVHRADREVVKSQP